MPGFRDISIKRKLTLIIMFTSTIALVLACAAFLTYDWISSKRALTRRLETIAEVIGSNSTAALTFDDARAATEILAALSAEPHVVSGSIYTVDGRVFARYHRDRMDFAPPPSETDAFRFEEDHLVLFQTIWLDGEGIGSVYIQSDLAEMQDRLRRFASIVGISVVVSSLVAFGVGSGLRELISEPILHLAQQMRRVSEEKNYSVRAQRHSQDEIGLLIEGFNEMLAQIQDRDVALQNAHDGLEVRGEELHRELAERERAQAQIKASLQEKEVLLQEVHHRVKNNLQVISSLLDLQSQHVRDDRSLEMLRDSRNRVRSMALIHESLYHSKDVAQIDFADYMRDLSANLFGSYRIQVETIELHTKIDGITLAVDTAIPCGLIINELVSNALKYAFPAGREGEIVVEMRADHNGGVVLTVADNGVGFPSEVDFRDTSSLGLQLVNTLVRQLRGTIELTGGGGTRFEIAFSAPK